MHPSEENFRTYSYQILGLFIRICVEIEANFKAILTENNYTKSPRDLVSKDYKKIAESHALGKYRVKLHMWSGRDYVFEPYKNWLSNGALDWYEDYHAAKHDRQKAFCKANLLNLTNSLCGLNVLIAAQFGKDRLGPTKNTLTWTSGPEPEFFPFHGDEVLISFPKPREYPFQYEIDKNFPVQVVDLKYRM